ncbi:hypothetical protein Prudu_001206 [Prunus dulcis]|uniref:Uncharacterized protein n=1 Tax=Prunus dulcis TaxID=3755 RepID=A0A4Y1QN15_PRUDU|nr:hypothetical protein Prudu_001206 [Prunus dulcis]
METPLSSCSGEQLVCNGGKACRLRAYVGDIALEKTPLSLCSDEQLVCNRGKACRLCAYVGDISLKKRLH